MSKKHRRFFNQGSTQAVGLSHDMEYKIIRTDLLKVLVLNVIFLAAVLTVYYTNQQQHYLEQLFNKYVHM